MLLYACMWPDGHLLDDGDGEPVVFTTEKAAGEHARCYRDYDGKLSLKVVSSGVEWKPVGVVFMQGEQVKRN